MFDAHESYRDNCHLSIKEVDFLVEAVRKRGSGGGIVRGENHRRWHRRNGGGVRQLEALREQVPQIAVEYSRRVGVMPDIFEGTSPGAVEFGARRYLLRRRGMAEIGRSDEIRGHEPNPTISSQGCCSRRRAGDAAFSGLARGEEGIVSRRRADGIARALIHYHLLELRRRGSRKFASSSNPAMTSRSATIWQGRTRRI